MENKGNNNNNGRKNNGGNNRNGMTIMVFILAALLVLFLTSLLNSCAKSATNKEVSYSEFIKMIEDDKVAEVKFTSNRIKILPKGENKLYRITYYTAELRDEELLPLLREHNVKFSGTVEDVSSAILWNMVSYVLPLVLVWILLYFLIFRKMGGGGVMGVGKTTAKVYVEKSTGVTFKDVAGQDEAKESLQEVVDFLHNPKKYTDIGAKLPKGALLVGPPGTGKTLLAKAVAGEANVPFFSLAGSDFVEMFVGVGASRVRDLFKEAQKQAPCIIFIDEIDAIGKSRDTRYGGNDEREQTLNQLLAEMDGFDTSKGLLILAATNRPEVLDKALLRPGRFDRRIIVDKPDLKGRVDTLKVHAKNVLMDDTVDLDAIALATSGAVGSDLANMINEAAINAVKQGRKHVNQEDLFESVEVVIAGKEKKDRIMGPKEKKMVAYHEVGHALVTALQKDTEPVQKITIVPRTMGALGYTMQVPEEEKYLMTKNELVARLVTYMGGRAAEEIVFDSVTTGASNDIEQATKMARAMVTQYGMSDRFGLMGLVTIEDKYLEGRASLNCGEETAAQIDQEVMKILKNSYDEAVRLLQENRDILDEISEYLYEHETITGKEFMQIFRNLKGIPEPEEKTDAQKAAEEFKAESDTGFIPHDSKDNLSEPQQEFLEEDDDLLVDTLEEPLPEEFMFGMSRKQENDIQIIPLHKSTAEEAAEELYHAEDIAEKMSAGEAVASQEDSGQLSEENSEFSLEGSEELPEEDSAISLENSEELPEEDSTIFLENSEELPEEDSVISLENSEELPEEDSQFSLEDTENLSDEENNAVSDEAEEVDTILENMAEIPLEEEAAREEYDTPWEEPDVVLIEAVDSGAQAAVNIIEAEEELEESQEEQVPQISALEQLELAKKKLKEESGESAVNLPEISRQSSLEFAVELLDAGEESALKKLEITKEEASESVVEEEETEEEDLAGTPEEAEEAEREDYLDRLLKGME